MSIPCQLCSGNNGRSGIRIRSKFMTANTGDFFKRANDFLAGWPMTLIGGIFLVASFILPRIGYSRGEYFAWVCVIICGLPLLYLSIFRIIHNKGISKISSALLITMAMIAALLIGDLFAAGEVAFIMEIGALLEDMTTERAKKGLKNLIALTPEKARVIRDGKEYIVPVSEITEQDMLRILPGETIPVDGIVSSGVSSVDQSVMTGESLPIDKKAGDEVYSGTINCYGSMDITALRTGEDSSIQKLIRMVQEAEEKKAPTQTIADKWASWLVPVALLIAIGAYLITGDIIRAVTVMVVFCPCALVLATPTAIMAAIGQATKHGVIIKSGQALEEMGQAEIIAFDKTGTLTRGQLEVSEIISLVDVSEKELLVLAASVESRSEHPFAKAIQKESDKEGLSLKKIEDFRMQAGGGVSASVEGTRYYLGKEAYITSMTQIDSASPEVSSVLDSLREKGKASVIIADESRVMGIIALSDTIRPETKDMVKRLQEMKVRTVLLTGDNIKAAGYLASRAGISDIRADLMPGEKVDCISSLKESGKVCMIGDGVNDAPALKTADIGVAMGVMGSDIAVDAADVALMKDDLTKVPYLKWLGNTTIRTIRTAITLSMCINFIAITLSVLGVLTPTTGALVHNAGSCFVVLLAALLYDRKYPKENHDPVNSQ